MDPVAAIGRHGGLATAELIALDPDLQLPATDQVEAHHAPPDLVPGAIGEEGFSGGQEFEALGDLGGAAAGHGDSRTELPALAAADPLD